MDGKNRQYTVYGVGMKNGLIELSGRRRNLYLGGIFVTKK